MAELFETEKGLLHDPFVRVAVALFVSYKAIDELAGSATDETHWFDRSFERITRFPKALFVVGSLGYALGTVMATGDNTPLYAFIAVALLLLASCSFYAAGKLWSYDVAYPVENIS